jgi:hypothetical protein
LNEVYKENVVSRKRWRSFKLLHQDETDNQDRGTERGKTISYKKKKGHVIMEKSMLLHILNNEEKGVPILMNDVSKEFSYMTSE